MGLAPEALGGAGTLVVLVIGGTGYIGGHLVRRLLESGNRPRCLIHHSTGIDPSAEIVRGDLLDKRSLLDAFRDVDIVYHLASLVEGESLDLCKVNVEGTRNLIVLSKMAKIARFVYVSSTTIYEGDTSYARSKRAAELAVAKSTLSFTILRFTSVYGPSQGSGAIRGLNSFINWLRTTNVVPLPGNGKNLMCPLFVDDAVSSLIRCVSPSRTLDQSYDISGSLITLDNFVDLVSEISRKRTIKIHLPLMMITSLARFLRIDAASVRHLAMRRVYPHQRAQEDFGYEVTPIEQALSKTLTWLKSERENARFW